MKTIIDSRNRSQSILFIVLCLTLLNIRFAAAQNTEILEAKHLVEVDQTKKAIEVLTKAIQTYPAVPSLHYYLGMAQLGSGTRDVALKTFEKGISVDDKEPLNYVGRGRLSMLENNAQKAKLDFDKALSLSKSKNVAVLQGVADAYMIDPKRSNDAMNLLNKAKAIDDHDAETLILLGDAFLQQNNGGQAVTNYERAASLNTKLAKPHYKIGLVYLRSRNYPAAQEAFNKAIALDPGYTLAYKEIGENYYSQKEATKAVAAYEKYMGLTENPEPAKLRMAFFYFMAKDYPKANTMFENLVTKPDASITAKRFYAQSLFESGNYEKSRTMFDEYFAKAKPEDIAASDYAVYGKLLQKIGIDSLAVVAFQKSIDLDPKQQEVLQLQSEAYFKLKKYQEAIGAYEKLRAVKTKWSSPDLYTVGRAYYFQSQTEQLKTDTAAQRQLLLRADSAFQKLTELQPNMTISYSWAARTKASLDPESEKGLAKPFYEKLIEKALLTPDKNRNDLIEAYSYLGYYHFLKREKVPARTNWEKVLALDPNSEAAKTALDELKKM
ncbi:MAG TPA: tetratricopeptide repeat protein [Chryseolinea sp.]|nr:tetratricopeptide repeat protein [Chryseolinea sp.]